MALVTLRQPEPPLLMFHGTSSAHLPAILGRGLLPTPPAIASRILGKGKEERLVAFEGTYLSYDPDRAVSHARSAARAFGGEPLMVTAQVVPSEGLPDEDEMLYVLQGVFNRASEERDWAPGFPGLFHDPGYRRAFARDAAAQVEDGFEPDAFDREAAEAHIDALMEGVILLPRDRVTATGTAGWLEQAWAMRLTRTVEGLARYRAALDGLCRSVVGARPAGATADHDGYKLRLPGGVPLEGPTFVAAVGSLDDPRRDLDRLDEAQAAADDHLFARAFLGGGSPRP